MSCVFYKVGGLILTSLGMLAVMAVPATADNQTLRSADNAVWLSGGGSFFNYKEPSVAPNLPDSERGELGSVAAGASVLGSGNALGLAKNLYAAIETTGSFGDAHYNGAYFYYPTVALQGTTSETIWTVDGKLGRAFPLGNVAMLIPYGELGYRYWNRDLGGGQTEEYQNGNILGGVMLQLSPAERWILSAYGAGGTTFAPQMQTDGTTYDLGLSGMYKIGAKIGFDVTPKVELFSTLDYDHFSYGKSSVIAGAYEPNSHTEDTAVRVGAAYHFR
jgi:hypothetical protein